MFAGGLVLLFVGALAWVGFAVQKYKAGRLAKVPFVKTGEAAAQGEAVAGDKGAISTEGDVQYGETLQSPVTGTECLYYNLVVQAKWKSGDDTRTVDVLREKNAVPFTLDDGSGPIRINAEEGGDLDLENTYSKTKGRGIVSTSDSIEFGDNGFKILTGQKINGVRIPDSAKYEVKEEVLLPLDHAYVNGKMQEDNSIGSPNWASLILSQQSREELVEGTQSFAKKLMYGASASTAVGGILAVTAQFVG